MSNIQDLGQQVTKLVSDSNTSATSLYNIANGLRKTTETVQHLMQSTSQHNYQNIINQLSVAQNKLASAAGSLVTASHSGKAWLDRHVGGGVSPSSPARTGNLDFCGVQDANSNKTSCLPNALSYTQQERINAFWNGRKCTIYDHPFDENSKRICNQGSAYPTGPQNTCGCCSGGTIVNKAGGDTNEHDVVALALNRGFCDDDGFTTANTIADILTTMGVPATVMGVAQLSELAEYVERGQGVIIAVNARRFDPKFYRQAGGHAIVLESVIRDAQTNEILEYVVVDSNRENSIDAARRVEPWRLEQAFRDLGNQSISTKNIIW